MESTMIKPDDYTQQYLNLPMRKLFGTLTQPVHYYDCTCEGCMINRHYPCGNMDCDYCLNIGSLLNNGIDWNSYTKDDLISYADYLNMGESDGEYFYNSYDYVLKHCDKYGCDTRINAMDYKENHGYCAEHVDCYANDDYDNEDDDSYEDDDYDNEYHDHSDGTFRYGHTMGEVLDPSEYHETHEAWIAPSGKLHFVPSYNHHGIGHYETAQELGFSGTDGCERAGYIHVSTYYSMRYPFHYVPENVTESQYETVQLFCDANDWTYPQFLQDYLDLQKDEPIEEITIMPMQNLSPSWLSMKRSERDKWYPLSGD